MKKITTQAQLNKLKRVEVGEEIIIESTKELILNSKIEVFGILKIYSTVKMEKLWQSNYIVARGNSSVEAWENSSVEARENSSVEAWENSSVEARENSSVVARENSSVVARENSSVEAWENSSVEARENSSVVARENSSVVARENSSVEAWENSSVEARENSSVVARGNSSVVAWGNSSVVARGNSSVVARGNSSVVAWGNSSVVAWGNSSVVAWENSSVVAWGWSVVRYFLSVKLEIKSDFCTCIEWKQVFKTKQKTIVYKKLKDGLIATLELKKGLVFQSQYHSKCRTSEAKVLCVEDKNGNKLNIGYSQNDNNFEYPVGKTVFAPYDERIEECSTGIHFFLTREEAERY